MAAQRGDLLRPRGTFNPFIRLSVTGLALAFLGRPSPVTAAKLPKPRVVVIPLGTERAFTPTARVADALVRTLRRQKRFSARMGFFLPDETGLGADEEVAAQAYKRAKEAFQALEFESVREQGGTAIRLYKAQIEAGGSYEGYVETLHLLAATELFDNRREAATRAMSDALAFSTKPPSPRLFNPAVQQLFNEVRQADSRGSLVLKTRPGALIWFNGRLQGFAGGKISRRAGLYWVRIARPNFAPWLEWVRIHPNQTQVVTTRLKGVGGAESALMVALRAGAQQPTPPAAVSQAAEHTHVAQIVLVSAQEPCSVRHCRIVMNWAADGRWLRRGAAIFSGRAEHTAAQLIGRGAKPRPQVAGAMGHPAGLVRTTAICRTDHDCIHGQSCEAGVCRRASSVTEKWWFWTIVGVVAAGAAAGVAVPLMLPTDPVIEVR